MNKIKKHLCLVFIISFCIIFNLTIKSNAATGTISTETIRLRKTTSTKSDILELLSQGEKVEVISEQDGWYKVKYKGITGYLSKEYVTVKGDVPNNSSDKKAEEPKQEETSQENKTDKQESEQETQTNEGTKPETTENQTSESNQKVENQTTNTNLNLYLLPLVNSTIICEIKPQDTINKLEEINNWTYISTNGVNGWVITSQLSTIQTQQTQQVSSEPTTSNDNNTQEPTQTQENNNVQKEETKQAYIKVEQLNFRKKTSTDSEVIDTLKMNTKVEVLGTEGEWSKIKYNGKQGYVATKYLSDTKVEVTNRLATQRTSNTNTDKSSETPTKETNTKSEDSAKTTPAENTSNNNSKKSELVAYAKQFLGSRYVHGGTSPKGFDCSGFTQYVYKHFGYNISRSSSAQSKNGTYVEKSNLQVGDLVFFSNYKTNKGIGHVGIYIGNNQFIHASTEKTGVIISSLSSSTYQKRYITARRIL